MPTSVLWVTLIALWLFVLVPMVLRGRPQARKTTAAAANTRLVHRGGAERKSASRTATRARAAQRAAAKADEHAEERRRKAREAKAAIEEAADEVELTEDEVIEDEVIEDEQLVDEAEFVDEAELVDEAERDDETELSDEAERDDEAETVEETLAEETDDAEEAAADDVDVVSAVELTDQIPVVQDDVVDLDEAQAARAADQLPETDELDDEDFEEDAEYEDAEYEDAEYDDYEGDEEAAEYEDDPAEEPTPRELRGRGGYGPNRVAEREAMQYRERQRMVIAFGVLTIAAIVSAFFFQPWGIAFACGMVAAFATYLTLLRRAVRHEHMRQAQRAARRRRQEQEEARLRSRQAEPTYVEPPARLRRPGGAIVLEIDDEDPAFDHLPTYDFAYHAEYQDDDENQDVAVYRRAAV